MRPIQPSAEEAVPSAHERFDLLGSRVLGLSADSGRTTAHDSASGPRSRIDLAGIEVFSAEEEGFEPTVAFRLRRFSNSDPPSAMGCTERKHRENEPLQTEILAPNGTERHRDQNSDQSADHETKEKFGHEQAAEKLLVAVAEGLPESVERARELVAAVLGDSIVRRAVQLDGLLREGKSARVGACG
jgi:hypothetical protein